MNRMKRFSAILAMGGLLLGSTSAVAQSPAMAAAKP